LNETFGSFRSKATERSPDSSNGRGIPSFPISELSSVATESPFACTPMWRNSVVLPVDMDLAHPNAIHRLGCYRSCERRAQTQQKQGGWQAPHRYLSLKYAQGFWFEQDQAQVWAVFPARQQLQFSTKSIPLYSLSCDSKSFTSDSGATKVRVAAMLQLGRTPSYSVEIVSGGTGS
jgi:hypothetical protein